jgi:hypothetical protein
MPGLLFPFVVATPMPVLCWTGAMREKDLCWNTVDGGGVMRSKGEEFELSGTIGQADAGFMAGGTHELSGGFWLEMTLGDCNEDGIISLLDHGRFAECLAGPVAEPPALECFCFDLAPDESINLSDFAFLQNTFAR